MLDVDCGSSIGEPGRAGRRAQAETKVVASKIKTVLAIDPSLPTCISELSGRTVASDGIVDLKQDRSHAPVTDSPTQPPIRLAQIGHTQRNRFPDTPPRARFDIL